MKVAAEVEGGFLMAYIVLLVQENKICPNGLQVTLSINEETEVIKP